jgi:uncharacterized protein
MQSTILRTAAILTGLYVVQVAFLTRQPGTSAGDHAVGAAATLAVLAAGALAFRLLPSGGRAVLGILLGLYATLRGALAVAEIATRGEPPLRDLTGTVLLAAGIAALAIGVVELWRCRRRGYLGRVARGAAAAAVGFLVVLPVLTAVAFVNLPRQSFAAADLGRPHLDVSFRTSDGLRLHGWYVPSRNGSAVIAFPARSGPVPHARMLVRHGYGVLLFDPRGRGDSDGDPNPFGWGSAKDLQAAVRWLERRSDLRGGRIGGLGLSYGGEQLLEAAAGTPGLAAVVSEGAGYRTMHEYRDLHGTSDRVMLPTTAVMFGALRVLSPAAPPQPLDELVPRIAPRPVFLIEADHGQGGEELNDLYTRRARGPVTHWLIPEAHHTGGLDTRPREYERRVVGFFDRTLRRQAP